ncbi:hypothetical protein MFRU_038g00710 [Monilinia fructicola]|nr:hypothetical protein MFRU_038g00710 [Monilinia fructicola]
MFNLRPIGSCNHPIHRLVAALLNVVVTPSVLLCTEMPEEGIRGITFSILGYIVSTGYTSREMIIELKIAKTRNSMVPDDWT